MRRIGELYAIEEAIRSKPPNERRAERQAWARPLLDNLERWLHAMLAALSPQRCGEHLFAFTQLAQQGTGETLTLCQGYCL